MTERTDSQVILRLVHHALSDAGLPVETIFARAGVDLERLDDPRARTPIAAHASFWRAVQEVTGDSHAGLHLGEHLPLFRGQVLEHLFTSSATFGDGLRRALGFHRLLSDALSARLVVEGEHAHLLAGGTLERHSMECLVVGAGKFFAAVTDGRFRFTSLAFRHGEGAPPEEYVRVYGCPVTLGASEYRLSFERSVLDYHAGFADPGLLDLHERAAEQRLGELRRRDRAADVERAIGALLESGGASLEGAAAQLGVPARRLRAELSDAGTSFQQLLDGYRERLARRLLARTNEPIAEVAALAGFSEPSAFHRAFKRWTSETPAEYRRRRQEAEPVSEAPPTTSRGGGVRR